MLVNKPRKPSYRSAVEATSNPSPYIRDTSHDGVMNNGYEEAASKIRPFPGEAQVRYGKHMYAQLMLYRSYVSPVEGPSWRHMLEGVSSTGNAKYMRSTG